MCGYEKGVLPHYLSYEFPMVDWQLVDWCRSLIPLCIPNVIGILWKAVLAEKHYLSLMINELSLMTIHLSLMINELSSERIVYWSPEVKPSRKITQSKTIHVSLMANSPTHLSLMTIHLSLMTNSAFLQERLSIVYAMA